MGPVELMTIPPQFTPTPMLAVSLVYAENWTLSCCTVWVTGTNSVVVCVEAGTCENSASRNRVKSSNRKGCT